MKHFEIYNSHFCTLTNLEIGTYSKTKFKYSSSFLPYFASNLLSHSQSIYAAIYENFRLSSSVHSTN